MPLVHVHRSSLARAVIDHRLVIQVDVTSPCTLVRPVTWHSHSRLF
ncbi:hypothetical protein PROP_03118 [Propionicimonas sp. T2.31MG-18]